MENSEEMLIITNILIIIISNIIVYQPELRTKFFYIDERDKIRGILNRSIWGKLIKNKIFQEAIINIGPKYSLSDGMLRFLCPLHRGRDMDFWNQ